MKNRNGRARTSANLAVVIALSVGTNLWGQSPSTQPTTTTASAPAAEAGSADAMIAAVKAIKLPTFDPARRADEAYVAEYQKAAREALTEQTALRLAFVKAYPSHKDAPGSSLAALQATARLGEPTQPVVDTLLALPLPEDAKWSVRLIALDASLQGEEIDFTKADAQLAQLKQERPKAIQLGMIAYTLARRTKSDPTLARMRAVAAEYADTPIAKMALGAIRQADGLNKPFELVFDDAVTGKHIDLQKDLRGKVVVIDFWATWCGPCVAEMPTMKALYTKFHDQGVEFLGVSLDQSEKEGGRAKLLDFVAKNKIEWPQYYQGAYWESEFSSGWGINGIPALFVVDADGNLNTIEGRGRLETLLPQLIAARDKK